MMKTFFGTITAALLAASCATISPDVTLPGTHADICLPELTENGSGSYVVFAGSWSGLEQSVLVPDSLLAMQPLEGSVLLFAATPGKSEWGVEPGCTVYSGSFDGAVFTALEGQRTGETVTYRLLSDTTLRGDLEAPGVQNFSEMALVPGKVHLEDYVD